MALNVIERPGRPKVRTTPFPKVDVVTRTFLQERYNSERWVQMVSEPVRRVRPFWLFDSILDDRTTQTCRLCNGVLLPWDHQWWQSHKPPLHWGCRSIIRAVSKRTATRRGVTELLPTTDVRHPFGTPPGKRARSFRPAKKPRTGQKKRAPEQPRPPGPGPKIVDKTKFDAQLIAAAEKKKQLERQVDPRVEGVRKLQSLGIKNVHLLSDAIDPNEVYELLKSQGADVLFSNPFLGQLDDLTLGAKSGNGWSNGKHGPATEINDNNNGVFSAKNVHGASYLKVHERTKDRDEAGWQRIKAWREGGGKPVINPLGKAHKVDVGRDRELTRVVTHEFGHAVHMHGLKMADVDNVINRRFGSKDREIASEYGETNAEEYFAECYVAYRFRHSEMKQQMPKAFAMVQDVLRLRGLPL